MELGSGEIVLILIVALLIYGGRLPEVARALGKSFGELKRGLSETRDSVARDLDPGIKIEDEPPRETWRAPPASPEAAKEDITKPPPAAGDAKPDDHATRHEHPN